MSLKFYLSGPMDNCTQAESHQWRDMVATHLRQLGFFVSDPTTKDEKTMSNREIVDCDKYEISTSDYVIVHPWMTSVGTSMEMMYAAMNDIPILVVYPVLSALSMWVREHATCLYTDFNSLFVDLYHIAKDVNPEGIYHSFAIRDEDEDTEETPKQGLLMTHNKIPFQVVNTSSHELSVVFRQFEGLDGETHMVAQIKDKDV